MKTFYIIVITLLLTACHKKEPGGVTLTETIKNTSADTVYETFDAREANYAGNNDSLYTDDTLVAIDSKTYKLTVSAQCLLNSAYVFNHTYTDKGVKHIGKYTGFDAAYTFMLIDAAGKEVFKTVLTKKDFENTADGSIVAETIIEAPTFEGYVPAFNAFMFTVRFLVPESDVGDAVFLLLGRDGKLRHMTYYNSFGGSGCDGGIDIAPNGSFIVTNYEVLHRNGKKTVLNTKGHWLVARRLVNPGTILAIDEYNDSTKVPNARLVSPYGKVLKTFTYRGYYDVLGFEVPCFEDKTTIYLQDNDNSLRVIPRKNPQSATLIPMAQITRDDGSPKKPAEKSFKISNEGSNNVYNYLHDTVANTYRLKIFKE